MTSCAHILSTLIRATVAIAVITANLANLTPTQAQASGGSAELEAKLDSPGTLMLRNATLADWAFAIKQEWGINIVSGAGLQNEVVDAGFENTPLRDILSEILFVRGYGFQAVGNSLRIVKLEALGAMRPGFETAILPLDLLQPIDVEPSLKLLASQGATVQSIPSSRSLLVIDTPVQIKKIQAQLATLEENARKHAQRQAAVGGAPGPGQLPGEPGLEIQVIPPTTEVLPVQFLQAADIVTTIQTVVPEGRVAAMEDENRLIVSGPPSQVEAAADLLKKIDTPRQQVRITALLYDVDLEVMEEFGFNWNNQLKGRLNASGDPMSLFALSSENFTMLSPAEAAAAATETAATAATTGSLGGLATLSTLHKHLDVTTVIRALDTTDGSRLLARPNIIAYDRVEAKFQSVSEIPVQQLTQTSGGGNIGTTSFREAGITLTVVPSIMQDGTVKMDVTPEFSVLAGFQGGQPIIDRRSATTTIRLFDGQTSVIGGLLRRNELEKQSGLPHLARMKYVGFLFRDHETTVTESELLVFIKAEIIPMGQAEKPRDEAARMVGDDLLDQVPYASHSPITSYCGDRFCPYHHPRPWGSALPPSACTGCESGKHGEPVDSKYYGLDDANAESLPQPVPRPLPPSNAILPREPRGSAASGPPPVIVEEAQRRGYQVPGQRQAMRRLPMVSGGQVAPSYRQSTYGQSSLGQPRGSQPQLPSAQAQPITPPRSGVRAANRPFPAVETSLQ